LESLSQCVTCVTRATTVLHRRDPLLGRVAYRELGLGGFLLLGCLNAREGVCGLASDFGLGVLFDRLPVSGSVSGQPSASVGIGVACLAVACLFTGPEQAIEGTYGFARVTIDEADFSAITDALGDSWEILANAYKPYPCGVVLFPVIDGCLELRDPPIRRSVHRGAHRA
jgi:hypothetical protein